MLVTITRSASEKSWYANRIGESYHVLTSVKGKHRIDVRHYPDQKFLDGFFIRVEDCCIPKQDSDKEHIKEEDKYSFSCISCDWVFKEIVGKELDCPYCKKKIKTNPFNETDDISNLGTTRIV